MKSAKVTAQSVAQAHPPAMPLDKATPPHDSLAIQAEPHQEKEEGLTPGKPGKGLTYQEGRAGQHGFF